MTGKFLENFSKMGEILDAKIISFNPNLKNS